MTFACEQCGATLACEGARTATCPYCASPSVVERPRSAGQVDPMFVLPHGFAAGGARSRLEAWLRSRTIFIDSRVRRAAVEELRGIYVPAYLYSAVARTQYTASIGEHYTETEEYEAKDEHGKPVTKTRSVTRTEHCPLAGSHVGYVTDVIVSASQGLPNRELAAIEPFDLRQLRRFAPSFVTGWLAEEFSRSRDACHGASRAAAIEDIGARLRAFMPGDSHSDLDWHTTVEWESLDPLYVPVWVLALRWHADKPPVRVVINGQTGEATGKLPLSPWKIAIAVVVLAAIVATLILVLRR
jgi:DNA-directed RNA polymerase subunit RPC12/RpoP